MTDTHATLLPCPFCGGEAVLEMAIPCHSGASVQCVECDAKSGAYAGKDADDSDAIAIAAWNRRAAQAERMARLEEALKPVLQSAGDGIANVFEQMLLGKWRDDHGHDVRMNVHMLNLRDVLMLIAKFREDHLDYTAVTSARALSQEGSDA